VWKEWDQALKDPDSFLPKELSRYIDSTIARSWQVMSAERRSFLELLSRIDLSLVQANIVTTPETRKEYGIEITDAALMMNPYLLYEATRLTTTPIDIDRVDRGVFPTGFVRERFPIPEPAQVKTPVDSRRLRALCIRELERATNLGHTLLSRESIITNLRKGDAERGEESLNVTGDLLAVAEESFANEIKVVEMADGSPAYQLGRYASAGDLVRSTVLKRFEAERHQIEADWSELLANKLGNLPSDDDERFREEQARHEKAMALKEVAEARISVLIGPAGTGKTTLLSILCKHANIADQGVVMLAPTGKARVRMEAMATENGVENFKAFTLAQFLNRSGRYDGATGRYLLNGKEGTMAGRTVIVDECSMLTEEMMAALIEALKGVHRLILVGDPRQLPPIGAGRPFVDIIAQLTPTNIDQTFPRVGRSYAELTVPRRTKGGERDDLQLASWFGDITTAPGEDQVFEILSGKRDGNYIRFVQWETPDELERLLPDVLSRELDFEASLDEWQAFAKSLGAVIDNNGSAWFNVAWADRPSAGKAAEAWQILCPVRQKPWGVDTLNKFIHRRYKSGTLDQARMHVPAYQRKIPKPMGEDQLVYGDKVMNNQNSSVYKKKIYPEPAEPFGYIANGEIGTIVGHRKTKNRNWVPKEIEIEFSTQPGRVFKFKDSDFSDERGASLDLAYALTVHKAQGSEFEIVFLVLPRSPLMLTRELIYTALTRQRKKVIVLHQGSATDLQKLSAEEYTSTKARLTNLFVAPSPIKVGSRFLERNLIHITVRGEAVRSKSEVIIANLLHAKNVHYGYETPLEIGGVTKYPDFTIEDDDTGISYYWEHCGMLSDPGYRARWAEKKEWYRENGILPAEEGGGPNGTLIITVETLSGGFSSQKVDEIISTVLKK
jgi:ATP-dependent exoDNAse (exonuclease V) alpha subunit